ncbi:MAG TPA: hypothetical protein VER03_25145 [Bryobacteraceae bacterium]|nr:hypothetical protein [Bryobacteraceae bacterium]
MCCRRLDEDGVYLAEFPQFAACVSHGRTACHAGARTSDAIGDCLRA